MKDLFEFDRDTMRRCGLPPTSKFLIRVFFSLFVRISRLLPGTSGLTALNVLGPHRTIFLLHFFHAPLEKGRGGNVAEDASKEYIAVQSKGRWTPPPTYLSLNYEQQT